LWRAFELTLWRRLLTKEECDDELCALAEGRDVAESWALSTSSDAWTRSKGLVAISFDCRCSTNLLGVGQPGAEGEYCC
jgi:hypothetical protein